MKSVKRRDGRPGKHSSRTSKGLRVLLYAGLLRPRTDPDKGLLLLKALLKSRHQVVALILKKGDPLADIAAKLGVTVSLLPKELSLPFRTISRKLLEDPALRNRIDKWVEGLSSLRPDVGVVFYGHWIPPSLFTMPPHGFLNYHPAPLPDLRGMEPDTLAILQGRPTMCGTVHQISLKYDDGPILAYTPSVKLTRYSTPLQLFETLTQYGIRTIVSVLDRIAHGTAQAVPQREHHAQDATRKRAREESIISWRTDTIEMIDRRRRAFLGQDIGIRLKADINGTMFVVDDVETHDGLYPGKPGQVLGAYAGDGPFHGFPVVRAKNGVAVLRTGMRIPRTGNDGREPAASWILPAGRQPKQTRRALVRRSVNSPSTRRR